MVKVAIVVPIYNVEKYLRDTLDSVVNQTLEDIEIICIDDASTDNSLKIIREYEQKDSRIKVIAYEKNKSSSQARKDGALCADAEFIMYLDGDDYLELNTCEELYEIIKNEDVEMLQFGTNIWNEGNADADRISRAENFMKPYEEKLYGEDVFDACFIENKYKFSIWNKIYSSQLCKKAFEDVKDGNFPKAQDLYAFYVLSAHAKSYYGIPNKYYNYRFGAGVTGRDEIGLEHFEKFCEGVLVAEGISDFANKKGDERFLKTAEQIRRNLLGDCLGNWYNYLQEDCAKDGFDLLSKYWKSDELVSVLCSNYLESRRMVARKVLGAECLLPKVNNDVKTIGIFYHRYALGGVQRVISLLMPMYISMGYKVVLFTDEFDAEHEYFLPEEVTRVILPSSLTISKYEYKKRAKEFQEKMLEHKVDIMFYHAASSRMLLFDMLLVKLLGLPFVLTVHEIALADMLQNKMGVVDKAAIYRIADKVTVLSRIEEKFWRAFGINAMYVPNPIDVSIVDRKKEEIEENTLLWVGRLESQQKRYMDTANIMREVVKEIPDAKLLVVGNEVSPNAVSNLRRRIEEFGLEENVILCGHSNNVDQYYRKSKIHVLTSTWEAFPMTITESKAYGIPLVTYELPFLEMLRSKGGFIDAEQGDVKGMAKAIIMLLKDKELCEKMGNEAKDSVRAFSSIDLSEIWKNIIADIQVITDRSGICLEDEDINIMIKMLLTMYRGGCRNKQAEITRERNKVKRAEEKTKKTEERLKKAEAKVKEAEAKIKRTEAKVKKTEEKIKKTATFKIGRIILFIPRKIISIFKTK